MLKILDRNKVPVKGLKRYDDLCIESVLELEDRTLSFSTPYRNIRNAVVNEGYIETKEDRYVVKEIEKSTEGIAKVVAQLDLETLEGKAFREFKSEEQTIRAALQLAFAGTGWTIGVCKVNKKRTLSMSNVSALEVLKQALKTYRAEIRVNSKSQVIDIYHEIGSDKGCYFVNQLNLKSLSVQSTSYDFYTEIEPYGKDGLTIETVNDGKTYLENYQYSSKAKRCIWKDERYTVPESLKEDAEAKLEDMSKPYTSYSADVVDLARYSEKYKILEYGIGDTINLIDDITGTREKQRIVEMKIYPDAPEKNSCTLANKVLTFDELAQKYEDTANTVNNITNDNGQIDGDAIDGIHSRQIVDLEDAIVTSAYIKDLDTKYVQVSGKLTAVEGEFGSIKGNIAQFEETYTQKLMAVEADIVTLRTTDLSAANGRIDILDSNYANIRTLLSGNAGIGDLQNIHLTSENAVIDSALIRSAVMQTVTIGDLMSGTISTDKFVIASDDGGIRIQGATQQWSDADGVVRMQAGRDASGDFTFSLFDKTGKGVLIDAAGIKPDAIADGLIVDKMVAGNANISGSKLDIESVISSINGSSETIKSEKIWFDKQNQTLNQLYSQMSTDITTTQSQADSAKDTASSALDTANSAKDIASSAQKTADKATEAATTTSQKVTNIETGMEGLRADLTETTTELQGLTDGTLLYNCTYYDNGDNTTTIRAVVYKAGRDVTKEFSESCYSWTRKTEAGEFALGHGYSITVNNADYEFGGVVVGQFETDDDTQTALLTMQEGVVRIDGKAVAFNEETDFVDANSFSESKTIPEEKKLLFVDAETNEGGNITAGNFKKQILQNLGSHDIRVDDGDTRLDEVLDKVQYDVTKGKHRQLGKACLWYHNFYDFGQNDDEAAAVIAQNEIVVAGGSLYSGKYTEEDKNRQLKIIEKARTLNPKLKIFYYITIASWRKDGDWSHILGKGGYWDAEEAAKHQGAVRIHTKWEMFQMLEYAAHIGGTKSGKKEFIETYTWIDDDGVTHTEDKYIDLYEGGISLDGCFYDDAGMESDEGRVNQGFPSALREKYIQLVDYTHSKGLAAFPNQLSEDWYADTVSTANPGGLPSAVNEKDYMLLESCHSQIGFEKKPLWRHVNGTDGVWNYYQNWYKKAGAKVVINDYLYGTGTGEGLTDEEFYELATYLVCDSFCCGAHYIDLNGLLTWNLPRFFKELLIPENEEYNVTRVEKGHYKLCANGHTLEVIRGNNLAQGDTVTIKSLNKVYVYLDGIRIKNMFKDVSQYMYETNDRLDVIEKDVEVIQTSSKSTANIYHRMMIDDWNKEFVLTNYVSETNFIKELEATAKTGIATVDKVDYETNSIRLTRINDSQINQYVSIDITNRKGHTLEIGFTVTDTPDGYNWGFDATAPAKIGWTWINKNLNSVQKSSFYSENFNGCIRRVTIPEDTEDEVWKLRICYNGSAGMTFELSNFYVVDVDEYGEDVTKDWHTNLIPVLGAATNNNNLTICYQVDKIGDYSFDITWNDPDHFANWSGLQWNFPDGTFKAGHTYEFGMDTYENNSGSANIAFRISWPSGSKWLPKTGTIKSSIYGDKRPGCIFTVPESATSTNGKMTFTNTADTCKNSEGEYCKTSIRGMYLYDINEENIVVRGQEPSNSFLRICRVTDEKLAKDTKLIGNALYFTDSGAMFVTDFNGNRTDITIPNNGIIDDYRLLPVPSSEDEGKILKVVNGKWVIQENDTIIMEPIPENVVLYEETEEDESPIDLESLIKNNLTLDTDNEFLYLMYGTEILSKVPVSSGEVIRCTGISIQEDDMLLRNDVAYYRVTVAVSPPDCTQSIRWTSSMETVAEITADGTNGVLKIVGEGTTVITVRCGNYSASINVSVVDPNIKVNIAKGASWFNSNNMPGLGSNTARAYSYIGSVTPSSADTTYSYGVSLQKGIKYRIELNEDIATDCYYGIQVYSSVTKTRILDSGWVSSGKSYSYSPTEDGLYLYANFKCEIAGTTTINSEILAKLTNGFSITIEGDN